MIYLDHAATTPVHARVLEAMTDSLARGDANPSAVHAPGRAARARVEEARAQVAALIHGQPEEIIFTSGATEADNLALLGTLADTSAPARHVVTSRIEHRAVLDCARRLEARGDQVSYVGTDRSGRIPLAAVEKVLRPDTRLVSIMLVNNETGAIQDVAGVAALCRARGILVHTDAAQAVGHLPVDVAALDVDLLSLSGHKMGGPCGIGALWVGSRATHRLQPLFAGGGQERGVRPGTLPVHQIVGLGEASRVAQEEGEAESARQRLLIAHLAERLTTLPGVRLNAGEAERAPHILNAAFAGVDGEALHASLVGLAVSGGSACGADKGEPSYVLRALGLADADAEACIRFSVGRETTLKKIEDALKIVENAYFRLLALGPT